MPSLEDWKNIASSSLKGRSIDSLERRHEDGLIIKPLYTEADRPEGELTRRQDATWTIASQIEPAANPAALNAAIMEELEGGAGMILLSAQQDTAMLADALDGVLLDAVRFGIAGGDWQKAAQTLCVSWQDADTLSAKHVLPGNAILDGERIAGWVQDAGASWPGIKPVTISGDRHHEAGHTDAGELAIMLAELAHMLRVFEKAGLDAAEALGRVHLRFAVGADLYGGLAKVRAARQIFARLADACGVDPQPIIRELHGVTSSRQMARLDADTNMLRCGTALLAMVLGDIGVATVLPHDWLTGSGHQSRRLARNSHHIMAAEARLDQVIDPASGSFHIDRLTHDLATLAWQHFQVIEKTGGITASQEMISVWAQEAISARQQAVNHGDEMLLGVTRHPRRDETLLPVIDGRGGEVRPAAPWEALHDAHAGGHRRILCLDVGESHAAAEAARWVQLSGIEPTVTKASDVTAATEMLSAAKPEIAILGAEPNDIETMAGLQGETKITDAALFTGDKLAVLQDLLGGNA